MDSLADICGKAFATVLALFLLAACPADAQADNTDREMLTPHAGR